MTDDIKNTNSTQTDSASFAQRALMHDLVGDLQAILAHCEASDCSCLAPVVVAARHAGDLLDRMRAGQDLCTDSCGDLRSAVEAAWTVHGSLFGADVEAVCDIPRSVPRVSASESTVHAVTANLLRNALDAMRGHSGRVCVKVTIRAQAVELTVSDQGAGMSAGQRKRATETGFTTKGAHGGSGLGLAQVRRRVKASGGSLQLSAGPDKRGTVVRVRWPIAAVPRPTTARISVRSTLGPWGLVASADDDLVRAAQGVFQGRGWRSEGVDDARSVLAAARSRSGSLRGAVLDARVTGPDAPSVVRELLGLRPDLPIVLVGDGYGVRGLTQVVPLARANERLAAALDA
ncbi:MAG: ATP-binding protein [Planctomycetota bacterium]|jgi:hypothetical protein|nr:ATP-binding protein [Planctomycetota bacterium]